MQLKVLRRLTLLWGLFVITSIYSSSLQKQKEAFQKIAQHISSTETNIKNIVVGSIEIKDKKLQVYQDFITENIIAQLLKLKKFKLVDRNKLKKLLKEHELNMTGFIDNNKLPQIGKLLAAQGVLFLKLVATTNHYEIQAKLIDIEKGTILASISQPIVLRKKSEAFIGVWQVETTAPYLKKRKLSYSKLVLTKDKKFELHLTNSADRMVTFKGRYRIKSNEVDFRAMKLFIDDRPTYINPRWQRGTIYLVAGKLYFNIVDFGRKRLDAKNIEYRNTAVLEE